MILVFASSHRWAIVSLVLCLLLYNDMRIWYKYRCDIELEWLITILIKLVYSFIFN